MSSSHQYRLWAIVALLSLLAAACSSFSDDPTQPAEVASPAVTSVAAFTATSTTPATPLPTNTTSPSPTATPEPYPGITIPIPNSDCNAAQLTGWGFVDGVYAGWVEGDGVDIGVPDGLLYEGNNRVFWRGDDGEMQFNLVPIDRPVEETHATRLSGTDEGGRVWSSWLTFESPGCWQISAEQGDNRVDATVVVYPTACQPDSFDLEDCPVPPYALYWNPDHSVPAGCDVTTVASLMTGFIDAVNRRDVESALAFFPDRDQDTDIDTTGLRWFSLEKLVAYDPAELRSLLTALIDDGEQLRLLLLDVGWGWHGGADFHVIMTRETDDLVRYRIEGKAAVNCELGHVYLFSASRQP